MLRIPEANASRMIRPAFLFAFLSSAFLAACQNSGSTAGDPEFHPIVIADSIRGTFPYMLTNPVRSYELPADLIEVSGITCLNDTALLLVQDEIGYLYRLQLTGGEVNRHIRFAGNGDFEGVTLAGDQVWAMRSDAKLYTFSAAPGDDADDDKWTPELPEGGDYESLAWQKSTGRLLIAAKEPVAGDGDARDRERFIFSLDPADPDSFSTWLKLDLRQIEAYLQTHAEAEGLESLRESFDASKKKSFQPSDMAIHPQTGELYIIASVGKILVVVSPEGEVMHVRRLPEDLFPQPEGICFGSDGTLYISHEGVNAPARVHVFPPSGKVH